MKFNFFLNSLSIHQAPLIKKLSLHHDVQIFYIQSISEKRRKLGWSLPDFGNSLVKKLDINNLNYLQFKSKNNVNIFSGINAYKEIGACLKNIAKNSESINVVQMESIDCNGFKGFLRGVKYKFLSYKYNAIVDAFLCQGSSQQYTNLGFKNCHNFAYFLDKPNGFSEVVNDRAKFIYLGAISKNKRILDLVMSIAGKGIHLDIYGSELDVSLDALKSEMCSNIEFKGVIPYEQVGNVLKSYDYLILPSKAEGWGSVVSEALLSGLGVIVTDTAGIINYIETGDEANVFVRNFQRMDTVTELMSGLQPLNKITRKKIANESVCLTTEYGVKLLESIISNIDEAK